MASLTIFGILCHLKVWGNDCESIDFFYVNEDLSLPSREVGYLNIWIFDIWKIGYLIIGYLIFGYLDIIRKIFLTNTWACQVKRLNIWYLIFDTRKIGYLIFGYFIFGYFDICRKISLTKTWACQAERLDICPACSNEPAPNYLVLITTIVIIIIDILKKEEINVEFGNCPGGWSVFSFFHN